MRYDEDRELNELKHRYNGERNTVNSTELHMFLGSNNYTDKAEELLLDILNDQYSVTDAVSDIREFVNQEFKEA